MKLKEKYNFVLEEIAKQPIGTYTIFEPMEIPDFLNDNEKIKKLQGNYTFNWKLTDKATDKDYLDYIKYVLEYTGMDAMYSLEGINNESEGKKNEDKNKKTLAQSGAEEKKQASKLFDMDL